MGALGIGSCSRTQAVEEEFQKIGIVGKSPSGRPGACSGVGQNKAAGSKSWWVWGRLAAKLEEVHGLEDKGGLTVSSIRALGCYKVERAEIRHKVEIAFQEQGINLIIKYRPECSTGISIRLDIESQSLGYSSVVLSCLKSGFSEIWETRD